MMYNLTIFQKSYFWINFKVSEKWSYVRGTTKKVSQGLGSGKKQFSSLQKLYFQNIFKKFICTPCQGFADGNRTKNEVVVLYFPKERSVLLACKTDAMGKPRKTSCKIYKRFAQQQVQQVVHNLGDGIFGFKKKVKLFL